MPKILRKNKGNLGNFKIIFKDVIQFNKRHRVRTWRPPTAAGGARPDPAGFTPGTSQTPAVGAAARPGAGAASLRGHQALATNRTASVPSRHLCGTGSPGPSVCSGCGVLPLGCGAAPCWPGPPPTARRRLPAAPAVGLPSDARLPRGSRTQRVSNCRIAPPPRPD